MPAKNEQVQSSNLLESLTPVWVRNQKWRERLAEKSAYRSLDMPEDVQISSNTSNKTGVGTGGILAAIAGTIAAMALGGGAVALMQGKPAPTTPTATSPVPTSSSPAPTQPAATVPAPTQPANPPANVQKDSDWRLEDYQDMPDGSRKIVSTTHYRARSGVVQQLMPDGSWQVVPGMTPPK